MISYKPFGYSLRAFALLVENKSLVGNLVKREILSKYKGSSFGMMWSLLTPLFMLAVYTFIFSIVFEARWGSEVNSKMDFSLILFSGLIVFNLFSECISKSPSIILTNVNYVKKVVFPIETLLWVNLGSAIFNFSISLAVWLIFYILEYSSINWTLLYLPIYLVPTILFTMGLSWFISSLGVFIRDIAHIVSILITILMFMSPIFYPIEAIPESFRLILQLNPLVFSIDFVRQLLFFGTIPDIEIFLYYSMFCLLVFEIGYLWFTKTKKGFADVL
ncbi:sugar ABC transporter permease [Vibrio diazotrophicus]|nr:sugar ABC transporter permease [Vibrio diazotrophicus]